MYNHLLAFLGFGLVLAGLGLGQAMDKGWRWDSISALLIVLLVLCLVSPWLQNEPLSMALCDAAALSTALAVLQSAKSIRTDLRPALMNQFCLALVLAGLLSSIVGAVQLFEPGAADNLWIANTNSEGRAVGNMRQPNQLATLLLWSIVAAIWLARGGWLQQRLGTAKRAVTVLTVLVWIFVLGILFSASRTGMVGLILLSGWAALDAFLVRSGKARLQRSQRIVVGSTPLMWLASWPAVKGLLFLAGMQFFTDARIHNQGAKSAERLLIFRDTFSLIRENPWTGTGWGAFNFDWTMTPFPGRYAAFVDHTHNVFLQFLVELGLPLGLICSVLLLWGVATAAWRAAKDPTGAGVCAFMLVVLVGVHSLSEFPLWYAYFLLPTALAFGLCMNDGTITNPAATSTEQLGVQHKVFSVAGVLAVLLVPLAFKQYRDIVHIYEPSSGAPPLVERLVQGQAATFFDVHADYAVATVLPPGTLALRAAERSSHRILDVRLMVAWAQSLHAVGQTDKARYVAERVREFYHPLGDAFFHECEVAAEKEQPLPFQCTPPEKRYKPEDLRP